MQTVLEFPNDLDQEYRDLIQDCAKVLTVSVIFYFLYNMTYQGSKTLRLSEKLFTDIISFLILGLASYHLILRKLINI